MVDRPDLLVLGALFHDLGKGYPGDHTEVGHGAGRADRAAARPGRARRRDPRARWSQHHLLLPDVAVRRDLSDPATISARRRRGRRRAGRARPAARAHRSPTRRPPVRRRGVRGRRSSSPISCRASRTCSAAATSRDATWTLFPDAETLAMMATGEHHVRTFDGPHRRGVPRRARRVQPHRRRAVAARPRRADRPGPLRRAAARPRQHGRLRVPGARAEARARLGAGASATSRRAVARRAGDRGAARRAGPHLPPAAGDAGRSGPGRRR